jgi:uncharacterized protein (TIGR02145 family)
MKKIIASAFLISLFFFGCKKNDAPPSADTPAARVKTTITGMVTNETGQFLQGATLTVEGKTTTTDKDGLFIIENVEVPASRYYIKATLNNYFESGTGGIAVKDGVTTIQIKLLSMGTAKTVSATTASTSDFSGAKLNFTANSFTTESGTPYTGNVQVYARSINPATANFSDIIPGGDLSSTMPDGSPATLESYGMVGVELRDANNNELKLANGKEAEVRFPIAASQLNTAPATIPLLSLDPATGVWKEEGTATKVGSEYVGKVKHFSWWNCDVPQNMSTVKGRVVDCNNKPLAGVTVVVNSQYSRITDANGYYEGMVPRIKLTFEVKMFGNTQALSSPVTLNSPTPGLNTIQDIKVGSCPTTVTGTLNRCGSDKNFYIRALWGQSMNEGWVPLPVQGNTFTLTVPSNKPITIRLSSGTFTKDTLIAALPNNAPPLNLGQITGCASLPTVKTSPITNADNTTATSGGEVVSNGGAAVTARGVVWSASPNPTVALSTKTADGTGTGVFTSNITGLTKDVKYYIRAYATNSVGTAYGNEISFTTGLDPNIFNPNLNYGSVTDVDGNTYKTIQIGTQVWMAENLRTTKYRNNTPITNITDNTQWQNNTTGAWSYYNNNATNNTPYGKLYNWYAVANTNGICPTGWHIPTDAEWNKLTKFLDPTADTTQCCSNTAGGKMKSTGTQYWLSLNTDATNSSGFSGLPGGGRADGGTFFAIGNDGYWWSSEDGDAVNAWVRGLYSTSGRVERFTLNKTFGLSVRCVRD